MNKFFHYIDRVEECLQKKEMFHFRDIMNKSNVIAVQVYDNYKNRISAEKTSEAIYDYMIKN